MNEQSLKAKLKQLELIISKITDCLFELFPKWKQLL